MKEVNLLVTLQVDDDDCEVSQQEVEKAGKSAVDDALDYFAQRIGFHHHLAADVSIGVADITVMQTCDQCEGLFTYLHEAMFCDGDDWNQPECISHLCTSCFESDACAPGWGWSNGYNDPDEYELTGEKWMDGTPKWRRKEEFTRRNNDGEA